MSFPHGENLLKHIFWQKWGILNALQLQKLENVNFPHFFTRPLGKNYSNSYFDKSKGLNNQEAEKMKSICSNHIFKPTLSNHFLQIDVDLIEKLIPCSLQGGPFGGPRLSNIKKICLFFWQKCVFHNYNEILRIIFIWFCDPKYLSYRTMDITIF